MQVTHGTWGRRVVTYQNDNCLVAILYLDPKKRCSWHKHITASNQFYVIAGSLGVKTTKGLTRINPGQVFSVPPGEMHEFITYDSPTVIEEVAFVKYDTSDIHREKLGGDTEDTTDESI